MTPSAKNFASRQRKLFLIIVLLSSFFCFLTTTTPVLAQTDPTEIRVKTDLEELKNAIAKAKEILAAFDNRQARVFVTQAEGLYQEAQIKYNQALATNVMRTRELLLKDALAKIVLAKANLERAVKLILDFPLTRLRNTLAELMRRAEQSVLGQGNREAQKLVYQARKSQLDAERAVFRQDPRRALELYQIAIALVEKAIALVEGRKPAPDVTPETTFNRERERYENFEKRAAEAIDLRENSAALSVFEQAKKQARAAQESFRKGEIGLAQQLYRGAIRLLLRAIDLAMAGRKDQNFGRNEVTLLQDLIQTAEQETNENVDPRAALFLERARVLVREAESAIDRQQPQEAKWRIELARNFVDKAMRKADGGALSAENVPQRYNEALQDLARDIEEVNAKAREANKPDVTQLVELAINAHQAAENAGRQNRLVLGFQLIRMAQHLLLRAETLLRDSSAANESNALSREAVLQRLTLIENTVQEISSVGDPQSCQTVQMQAVELLKRSRAALEQGQIRLALVIMEVANDLAENCLRK